MSRAVEVEAGPRPVAGRRRPELVTVGRRGPILRPARGADESSRIFGLDLTAGCGLACPFCFVRGQATFPGEGRVLFDAEAAWRLEGVLARLDRLPRQVVLSPWSEPLPPVREVRAEAARVARVLLDRGVEVVLMTRGRVPRSFARVLATGPGVGRAAVALTGLSRTTARALEPLSPAPALRLRGIAALIEEGVPVEVRLEPLVSGLNDTREAVRPLFAALARIGVRRVVAHYLFRTPATEGPLAAALGRLGLAEKLADDYEDGPIVRLGSHGTTKHLPRAARQDGFARLASWGAEFGLLVQTGAAQNPDLPLANLPPVAPPPAPSPRRSGGTAAPDRELQPA